MIEGSTIKGYIRESKIGILNKDKYEVLKILLIENQKDLIFWRERSWKFTSWLIGGFVTLSGLSFFVENAYAPSFLIVGLSIVGTIYLIKNYYSYSKALRYTIRIRTALMFYKQGVYIADEPLLTEEFREPPTFKGTASFITMIWIIAIVSIVATIWGGMCANGV